MLIWDEKQLKPVLTIDLDEPVLQLSQQNELFFVCMQYSVVVYSLFEGPLIKLASGVNYSGVHAISNDSVFCVAVPGKKAGQVALTWLNTEHLIK